jgi:hypothetical protein
MPQGYFAKVWDLGFLPKISPKILQFPQERFHFLARLHNGFGQ